MLGEEMWGLTGAKIHPDAPDSYWGIGSAVLAALVSPLPLPSSQLNSPRYL